VPKPSPLYPGRRQRSYESLLALAQDERSTHGRWPEAFLDGGSRPPGPRTANLGAKAAASSSAPGVFQALHGSAAFRRVQGMQYSRRTWMRSPPSARPWSSRRMGSRRQGVVVESRAGSRGHDPRSAMVDSRFGAGARSWSRCLTGPECRSSLCDGTRASSRHRGTTSESLR
jgi:hypothetical protein